jgi:hypothetical protein
MMLVLTVVVVASMMGMSYLSITSVKLASSTNMVRAAESMYLAESGVQHAMWLLRTESPALLAATSGSPLGPFQLDSDGGQYVMYAQSTGTALQYMVTARGTARGITRTSQAVARIYSQYNDKVTALGPIHLWRLGETSGNAAKDTGFLHNRDGTYMNTPLASQVGQPGAIYGETNKAVHFDGMDDYINLSKWDLSGNKMTILCWFKADAFNIDDLRFISKADGIWSDSHYWMLGTVRSGADEVLRMRLRTGVSTTTLGAMTGRLEVGEWTMATATYDGLWMKLYKDSQLVGTGLKMGNIAQNNDVPVWIGGNPDGLSSRPFFGTIDEVAIFDKALTASQIDSLRRARQASVALVKWVK